MGFRATWGIRRAASVALLASSLLSGCPGPSDATLTIIEPADGAELTLATDTNATLAGVQTSVRVTAVGVAVGDEVDILVDGSTVAGTGVVPDDGNLVIDDVTVSSGEHRLEAVTRSGDVRSDPITVIVSDACFAIGFAMPAPATGAVTLGPEDDTDGIACGVTFEAEVVVSTSAPDGSDARVFVNGTPRRTTTIAGGVARFTGVAFDNRGTDENQLRVEITSSIGTCAADFPSPILVDCAGVSCAITQPDTSRAYLSQTDDISDAPGFQGDFGVTTDTEGSGQAIRLIIDGNETDAVSALPDGLTATFGNISLSEGVHRVQGECSDASGNLTRSGVAEWTIDTTGCAVELFTPVEGELFIDSDDVDPVASGVQIEASGTAGTDCTALRVGVCSGIDGLEFTPSSSTWTQTVTLASTASQQLCAQSQDEAGNRSTVMVGVRLQTAAPQLEIATPLTGASFNVASDLVPSTGACDANVEVYCTDVGFDVELVDEGTALTIATASCTADGTVPAPYAGRATFTAPLPSLESGAAYNVFARQMADRLTGSSAPISIRADCIAPSLSIVRPSCGSTLLESQDENTATPEIEYRTNVQYPNGQAGDQVTLTIQPSAGGAPTFTSTQSFTSSPVGFFGASYGAGGSLDIIATATDPAGNVGTSPACSVTVDNLPTLMITSPTAGAVLGMANDCSADPGLQIRVRGTTDAAAGSSVSGSIGAATFTSTVGAGGAIDVCADATDGRSVVIAVQVTDARGTASAMVTVVIDTMAPSGAISDLAASIDPAQRRAGVVHFTWTAVADAGGFTLTSYQLRCAATPITNETEWGAATLMTTMTTPGSAGTMQSDDVDGFRTGQTRYCVLRGVDPAGGLTPLPASSTTVMSTFQSQQVTFGGSTRLGNAIVPIGDVNGDGIDDVLTAGTTEAYVYFGSASGLGSTASVRIMGAAGWTMRPAGIGDFNGDGAPDFALGASTWGAEIGSANRGAVFVFYGRSAAAPWPASIGLAANGTTCSGANVCFVSNDGTASTGPDEFAGLGFSVSGAGDFNGDGLMDLAVGAPGSGGTALGFPGRLYVILGSTTAYPSGTNVLVPGDGTAPPAGFFMQGEATSWRQLGNVVAGLGGDLDGDLRHDLLVLAAGSASVMARVGRLPGRMHDGSGLDEIALSQLDQLGTGSGTNYGAAIAGAGDVDGDGNLDALVYDRSASGGTVAIHFGRRAGFAGGTVVLITNNSSAPAGDQFGSTLGNGRHPALGNIGDIDEDGIADVATGAVEEGSTAGQVDFFYRDMSRADRLRMSRDVALGPPASSSAQTDGARAAFIGDVNGDGFGDIAVGDPAFMSNAGRFTIHY